MSCKDNALYKWIFHDEVSKFSEKPVCHVKDYDLFQMDDCLKTKVVLALA